MITLYGHLEHIKYFNRENHYTIGRFKNRETKSIITIVGFLSYLRPGEEIRITGTWENHYKYGEQFGVKSWEVVLPSSLTGIKGYLQSGIINGIGSVIADRLLEHFKENTLEIIEKNPDKLLEVKGIGKAKADLIKNEWKKHHAVRSLFQFLNQSGINASSAADVLNELGFEAENIIRKKPYIIAPIPGIGFNAADTLAANLDFPLDMPQRIDGALVYLMEKSITHGDTFIYKNRLILQGKKLLKLSGEIIEQGLARLFDLNELVCENLEEKPDSDTVSIKTYHDAETFAAKKIKALLSVPVFYSNMNHEQITHQILKKLALQLSSEQMDALHGVFLNRISIITGGPGTGKTTLIKAICAIFEKQGQKIILGAPTGRAARRLSEVTLRKAATIHKILGYNPAKNFFEKTQDAPIEADLLIIDEVSMVDTLLMYHLIKAVSFNTVMIMAGDASQLPSVGPGNVLYDMIKSETIPVFKLTSIFRQAKKSSIITNAHLIRQGKEPDFTPAGTGNRLSDFYFIEEGNPKKILSTIVKLCKKRIPEKYGLDPVKGVQVLAPMHKGEVGIINLNQTLQASLNNRPESGKNKTGHFKTEDKVMQLKNNYEKDVFNGETGIINLIDNLKKQIIVDYSDKKVTYNFDELHELSLAYAISVHKSQGSEYPAVIMPITTRHYIMLQRNLLYTAVTRGQKLVILVGTKKALMIALKNNKTDLRLSMFHKRLVTA